MDTKITSKFKHAEIQLRQLNTFYSSIYSSIDIQESLDVDTLELDDGKLLYNSNFIEKFTIPELTFMVIHEISHLLLMHECRVGDRDLDVWNVACDLYINKAIVDEFGKHNDKVKLPKGAVYWEHIDLNLDTEESLYHNLINSKDNSYLEKFKIIMYSIDRENNSITFSVRCMSSLDNMRSIENRELLRDKYIGLILKHCIFSNKENVYTIENKCKGLLGSQEI